MIHEETFARVIRYTFGVLIVCIILDKALNGELDDLFE